MTAVNHESQTRSRTNEYPRRPREVRRSGARILDTAEGVLITLRRYRVDNAFLELMQTAKRHNVNPLSLADALVTIAEGQLSNDAGGAAAAIACGTWGHLLGIDGRDDAPTEPRDGLPAENA